MKTHEKIDLTSDRYKVCKYCGEGFMAHHRAMVFCNEQHADEFHNRKKRLEAEEKLMKEANQSIIESGSTQNSLPYDQAIQEPVIKPPDLIDKAQQDLKFLNSLQIDPECGSSFNIDWMHSQGYDFGVFAGQGKLHNIDPANKCQFIQIGPYRMFRVEYSTVLIKKII